jgi:hypothetical protein
MKAKRVICVIKGHEWIVGRLAQSWARDLVKGEKSYHNRACTRCDLEQWNADKIEKEADRILGVKRMLGVTETQAKLGPVDPADRPCDPNEFP